MLAPFGRIGRALGFRWAFPIGTLPIPFHPGLLLLILIAPPLVIAHRLGRTLAGLPGGASPESLLIVAAVLAIPLSIPIVSWMAMLFQLALVQGMLIGGAMVLEAAAVAAGRAPIAHGLVPAAFAALFLIQRIGGPIALRNLRRENDLFQGFDPGSRQVCIDGDTVAGNYGYWAIRHCDVARVVVTPSARQNRRIQRMDRRYFRLTPTDADRVRAALLEKQTREWSIGKDDDILVAPPVAPDPDAVRVSFGPHRSALWLLAGRRTWFKLSVDGLSRRWVGGKAELVGNVPLFTAFRWIAIFGGRSHWVFGFKRRQAVDLGTERIYDLIERSFPTIAETGATRFADVEPLLAAIDKLPAYVAPPASEIGPRKVYFTKGGYATSGMDDTPQAAFAAFERVVAKREQLERNWFDLRLVRRHPEAVVDRGPELCLLLSLAKEKRLRDGALIVAQLLATLPEPQFQLLDEELKPLLGSRILALQWQITPEFDTSPLPKNTPLWGKTAGFGLVERCPELFERLGELSVAYRIVIDELGEEAGWPGVLVKARDEHRRRRIADQA